MMISDSRFFLTICSLCFVFGFSVATKFKFLLGEQVLDPLDFLIPTVHSDNGKCRNHSLLYKEELSNFTVWATDMFDASTKFPSGIFFGSFYDTGNFDECVKVHLPTEIGFSGQHCMAHFKMSPPSPVPVKKGHVLEYDRYENIFNISTWHKIAKYAEDGSKQPRDEFFFSFCIPSTCSHEDLQKSLRQIVTAFGDNIPFNLQVNVDERNCQVEREISFTRADTIYMTVMGTIISFGIFCTLYHLFTRLEGLQQFKFSENVHRVVKEFSFSHTIKKLASESKNEDGLESLNGMKVVSMFLIIMGHRMMFYISSPLANPVYVEDTYRHVGWMVLLNGPVLVDSFFTISGFLASYMMLSIIHKRRRMVNLGTVFLHRLLRLTPAYAVVLGFYCTIFIQLGDGPFWDERVGVEQERCLESWWTNILYINNYVKADKICMFQSWYLTCDTHYFLFAPALVYLLWKSPKLGLLSMGFLIGISIILPCVIIFINQEEPFLLLYMRFLRDPIVNSTFKNIYIPSHMRACAYLIGILTGYMKFHMRLSNAKINSKINYLGWIVSLSSSVMVFCVSYIFYVPTEDKDYFFAGVFGSLHHVIWSLFSAWVILSVSEGYGAWIAPLFNWRPLVLLGRITYPAFLCHGAIQLYSAATTRAPVHTGLFVVFNFAASDIVWAYIAGFILSLVIEAPIRAIEKLIMGNHEKISEERPIKNLEFGDKKLGVDSFSIRIPKVTKLHK